MEYPRDDWIARLYDTLGPRLYRHALLLTADSGLAEDAVQQAFLRLLSRGRVEEIASAEAFLRTVVRHEAYRMLRLRGEKQRNAAEPPLLEDAHAEKSASESAEERQHLERALRQLSPEQREVVHLKVYEQMTFGRIGEVLGVPANTAASRYRYALERLRELLPESRSRT